MKFKFILPALLALAFPIVAGAAPVKPQIAAKSQMDSRGVAALDKAVRYYSEQQSFSVAGRETLRIDDEIVRRTTFEFAAQSLERASLKISALDENDTPSELLSTRLLDADYYRVQLQGQATQTQPARTNDERQVAFVNLINFIPALGLSVGAFTMKTNPARTPFVTAVVFEPGPDNSEIVTTQNKTASDPTIVTARYTLDASSGAVLEIENRLTVKTTEVIITTEFDALQSNWKGSQAATDKAVYNWKQIAGLPSEQRANDATISVAPAARATFDRSVAFYQNLRGLHLVWKQSKTEELGEETVSGTLDYARDGRLRLQFSTILSSLVVIDGSQRWTLESELINPDDPLLYRRADVDKEDLVPTLYAMLRTTPGLPSALSGLVGSVAINPLSPLMLSSMPNFEGFVSFEARSLEAQLWNDELCDLVQTLEIRESDAQTPGKREIHQIVYWFAHSDGHLVRVQEGEKSGDEVGTTTDSQITEQTFNPDFAPDTFNFTPPKGAVLSTN